MNKKRNIETLEKEILCYLPMKLREKIVEVLTTPDSSGKIPARPEEIRLRAERCTMLTGKSYEIVLDAPSRDDIAFVLSSISKESLYAYEREISNGFITLQGGHRAGICGQAVVQDDAITQIKNISGINIRVASAVKCISQKLKQFLQNDKGEAVNTLIVSPPRCGKTTLLRELTRCISDGNGFTPQKVAVIDERSELAACSDGVPQLPVGIRTDVMDSCKKQSGIYLMLRSMSPQVIICDEIGDEGDTQALLSAVNAGVSVIVSAHGNGVNDLKRRPETEKLIQSGLFDVIVLLDKNHCVKLYDASGKLVFDEKEG